MEFANQRRQDVRRFQIIIVTPNRGTDHMMRVSAVKPGFTVDDVYERARALVLFLLWSLA